MNAIAQFVPEKWASTKNMKLWQKLDISKIFTRILLRMF